MSVRAAALVALLCIACAHAKQVETPAEAEPQPPPQPVIESHPAPPPPGHPVLSASPGGTFEPGAVRQIQQALRDKGYRVPQGGRLDDATQHQIARFQKSETLPDTGYPDDLTLRKLGLDPDKLHRTNQ
jgi:peptidoglycan hydrolase-like protein with peptidoglycan-binding domain